MKLFPIPRRRRTHRRVERLLESGIGVRESRWDVPPSPASAAQEIADPIVQWVRLQMGEMRRPHGIDHVALALACRDEQGTLIHSDSFGVVRPATFYAPEGTERIASFVRDAGNSARGEPREILAALLSLGDLAYELQVAKAA